MKDAGLERLVDRRVRNWEFAQTQTPQEPQAAPPCTRPYVAISRGLGSGGQEVAHHLSQRLGWAIFDRELLEYMANDDDIRRRLYALVDERVASWVETLSAPFRDEAPQRRDDYFHRLVRAVRSIAVQESAIFVGRGAGFLLQGESGLMVRIVAPFEACVARHAARTGLSADAAADAVRKTNTDRERFLHDHFGRASLSPDRHDLVINTGRFSPSKAADVIVAALDASGVAKGP